MGTLHLDDLYARCLRAGSAPRTVLHLHRVLHTALADAEAWDLVSANVARKATPPKVRQVPPEVLTLQQVQRLLTVAREDPFGALFVLAVTTGARQGELLGLRWQDIDLDAGLASVRQTVQRAERGRALGDPKTEQSRRTVEIVAVARDALPDAWKPCSAGWRTRTLLAGLLAAAPRQGPAATAAEPGQPR